MACARPQPRAPCIEFPKGLFMARWNEWRHLATAGLLMAATTAGAQTPAGPDSLAATVGKTVETAKQTQTKLDDWSKDRKDLDLRYRNAKANLSYLQERLARETERAAALDHDVAELQRSMDESTRLKEGIADTMRVVLGRLEAAVAADLPFLPEERQARLENLRKLMAQEDAESAEKLRILLEALLVEAQYGATIEVTPAEVVVDGQTIHADILRIGRLAIYWRSPDGKRAGTWDPARRAWTELPPSSNRVIAHSIEIAAKRRANELVSLPIGRISR